MFRLLFAFPFVLIGAVFGALLGVQAVVSPRGLFHLLRVFPSLLRRTASRQGWMVEIPQPASPVAVFVRVVARALGAFGAARLLLFIFGLGPARLVAVTVALVLIAWDSYWFAFLSRMSVRAAVPASALQVERTHFVLSAIVSVAAVFLFIRT